MTTAFPDPEQEEQEVCVMCGAEAVRSMPDKSGDWIPLCASVVCESLLES